MCVQYVLGVARYQLIDPMQKWLLLYFYPFVRIENSFTNLVFETKIVKKVAFPNEVSEAILNTNKRIS